MIIDKTAYFIQMRNLDTSVESRILQFDDLRRNIKHLENDTLNFKLDLERNSLPNFHLKEKKLCGIKILKESIETRIKDITIEAKNIRLQDKSLTKFIQNYFINDLRKLIIIYKDYESKDIINNQAIPEVSNSIFVDNTEAFLKQEKMKKNSNIKSSILTLGNSINQLKLIVKSQSSLIDTIDSYFEKSNLYLEEANKEVEKIPRLYTGLKNYTIYFLLYLICVLLCIILVKSYNFKGKKTLFRPIILESKSK